METGPVSFSVEIETDWWVLIRTKPVSVYRSLWSDDRMVLSNFCFFNTSNNNNNNNNKIPTESMGQGRASGSGHRCNNDSKKKWKKNQPVQNCQLEQNWPFVQFWILSPQATIYARANLTAIRSRYKVIFHVSRTGFSKGGRIAPKGRF